MQHKDGTIELKFRRAQKARFVKVHCYFDDRDIDNNPVDYATVSNKAVDIARVYYMIEWRHESYTYDDVGNRLTSTITLLSPVNTNYTYYPNTRGGNSQRLKSDGTYEYTYDNNGNLIRKTEIAGGAYWAYDFNVLNRLVAVRRKADGSSEEKLIAEYVYDEAGFRIEKDSAEKGVTWYVFSAGGSVLYEEKGSGEYKEFVYAFGRHFAKVEGKLGGDGSERKKYFYHTDHLGSTIAITNAAGEVVWHNDYTPFGGLTGEYGTETHDAKFTGKDLDEETGLYYFNARWYDAELGRFISQDPIKDGVNWYRYGNNPSKELDTETGLYYFGARYLNPQTSRWLSPDPLMDGENWYGYANNNPLKYVDPNGLESNEVIQSLINREKSVERAREYKNITAESNAKGRSQYEAGRKEYNKIEKKVKRFNNERERFIKKYHNSNKKNSIPVEQGKYRITCGNTDTHKGRTQGGVNKNRFVTDYAADEGTSVFTTARTEFKTNAQRWSYNDSSFSSQTVTLEDGEVVTVHTYGKGYGFRINGTIENGMISVWFAHGNPNSQVAKDFAILQMMAEGAGLQSFILPENTQIMEIGLTGLTTGPHLHYEEDIK